MAGLHLLTTGQLTSGAWESSSSTSQMSTKTEIQEYHVVPGSKPGSRMGTVITYSRDIPRFLLSQLRLARLPSDGNPEAFDTSLFGRVTIQRLARNYFEEQLPPSLSLNHFREWQRAMSRGEREISLFSRIQHHPGVIKICGFIVAELREDYTKTESHEFLALLLEHAPGGTVEQYLKGRNSEGKGKLGNKQVYTWALQLARTMAYLHDNLWIMHRDIRPGNIFVFENGNVIKLGNFHFATKSDGLQNSYRCDENIAYCAPEILGEQHAPHDWSVDVWSFGVFLFYITNVDKDGNPRVPFAFKKDGAYSFKKRLEGGEQFQFDGDVHYVFKNLICDCLKLENRALEGPTTSTRKNFAQIVRYLEENENAFEEEVRR